MMNPNSFSYIGIGIAVLFFLAIGGFYAINDLGLREITTSARVIDKHYTPAGSTYRTTVINGQTIVQPQGTDDIYAVSFEINGQAKLGLVSKEQYEKIEPGAQVIITAKAKRITRELEVVSVSF